jgi:hypothetical protein
MARHREYYKGEGGVFPQSLDHGESCEFVFARDEYVHQKCSNYAITNLLFGLCRFVSVIDLLITLPNPYLITLARPSTPEMLRTMERTPTLHSFVVFTIDSHLSLLRSLGVHQLHCNATSGQLSYNGMYFETIKAEITN